MSNKKRGTPGPGAYNEFLTKVNPLNQSKKTDKICAFIEEAKYIAHQSPSSKYNVKYVNSTLKTFRL